MIRPMLGVNVDLDKLQFPIYASTKLDGVRAIVDNGVVYSRTGKPIPNKEVQKRFSNYHGLDGELIVDNPTSKNVYKNTVSGVMTKEGTPNVIFNVFDIWNSKENYYSRDKELFKYNNIPYINIVNQHLITNIKELEEYELKVLNQGYEGVMIRKPDTLYKNGRSTIKSGELLKLKRFSDSEGIIRYCLPLMHNNNEATIDELGYTSRSTCKDNKIADEMLGSFVVEDLKNPDIIFNIGSGFTKQERIDFWNKREELIGKIITYKYFTVGMQNLPRFPIFKGFRDRIDIV